MREIQVPKAAPHPIRTSVGSILIIPLRRRTLLSCLRSHKVSKSVNHVFYQRIRCRLHGQHCFTLTFNGTTNKCRIHGPCCGNYVQYGSVSIVERSRNRARGHIYIFRNFVSFLSCLALGRTNSSAIYVSTPYSCLIVGSIGGLGGTLRRLRICRRVRYCLSGSLTKRGARRAVTNVCNKHMHGRTPHCHRCGSLGSCLHKGGQWNVVIALSLRDSPPKKLFLYPVFLLQCLGM